MRRERIAVVDGSASPLAVTIAAVAPVAAERHAAEGSSGASCAIASVVDVISVQRWFRELDAA